VTFVVAGAATHVGLTYVAAVLGKGVWPAILAALGQTGLMGWCVGLGALLATRLKEKNLLIPVSLFLAALDIFLVLTPVGPTHVILKAQPQILSAVGWQVPKVTAHPAFGPMPATALIGPADFVFMGMFFVAIFRFGLRARQTLLWLAPTLIVYMVLALFWGSLPALVPIGLCVLIVNFKEFKLTKEEWASTGLVVLIAVALIAYGATRPKPHVEISPPAPGQESAAPEDSPPPGAT
jgi:hypothetical protein